VLSAAPHPERRAEEERQREDHPEGEQRDRIDHVRIGELDEDRADREADDAAEASRRPATK
jgi:hypothetical protein